MTSYERNVVENRRQITSFLNSLFVMTKNHQRTVLLTLLEKNQFVTGPLKQWKLHRRRFHIITLLRGSYKWLCWSFDWHSVSARSPNILRPLNRRMISLYFVLLWFGVGPLLYLPAVSRTIVLALEQSHDWSSASNTMPIIMGEIKVFFPHFKLRHTS